MKKFLIALGGIIAAAIVYMGVIFAPEVKSFFTNLGKDTPTEDVGGENNENGEVTGDVVTDVQNSSELRLTKFNRISTNGQTLSLVATITPSYSTNKTLSWQLAWKESNSAVVSDYVGISVSADTLTCNVSFKKAFDKQIILTCTSNSNSSAKATCSIDYVGRSVQGFLTANNSNYLLEDMSMEDFGDTIEQAINNSTSKGGSIQGTIKNVRFDMEGEVECECGNVVFTPSDYDMLLDTADSTGGIWEIIDGRDHTDYDFQCYITYDVYYGDTLIAKDLHDGVCMKYNWVNSVVNVDNVSLNDSQLIF